MNNRKTGTLIAIRRQELELTQKELAERLHVSDRAVSKWERGAGFPDVSLLEPLADALELSVLELIHGQLDTPEEQLSPETEKSAWKVAYELSIRSRKTMRLYRWALMAMVVLMIGGVAWFATWWAGFFSTSDNGASWKEISVQEAVKFCPFSLITEDDYVLARKLLDDPKIGGLLSPPPEGEPITVDTTLYISSETANSYREQLLIEGHPADIVTMEVWGEAMIHVDYRYLNRHCILSIRYDGSIEKWSRAYKFNGYPYEVMGHTVIQNEGNLRFTAVHASVGY